MSQQSVRQAARRSALDAQAGTAQGTCRPERRLEGLAVAVLTALSERDGAVRAGSSPAVVTCATREPLAVADLRGAAGRTGGGRGDRRGADTVVSVCGK
jgi:hypothetical protein